VHFVAPDTGSDIVLDLLLELAPDSADGDVVTNRYRSTVVR
jgi:hypothetical protein